LPQDQIFRFQRCSRLEARSQDTENQLEQIGHQDASLRRPPAASTPNRIFGTHKERSSTHLSATDPPLSHRMMHANYLGQNCVASNTNDVHPQINLFRAAG
jgi:hypothetical protein